MVSERELFWIQTDVFIVLCIINMRLYRLSFVKWGLFHYPTTVYDICKHYLLYSCVYVNDKVLNLVNVHINYSMHEQISLLVD